MARPDPPRLPMVSSTWASTEVAMACSVPILSSSPHIRRWPDRGGFAPSSMALTEVLAWRLLPPASARPLPMTRSFLAYQEGGRRDNGTEGRRQPGIDVLYSMEIADARVTPSSQASVSIMHCNTVDTSGVRDGPGQAEKDR
ncbi:uncharacterized protein LOC119359646 isoform X2 [Triticum dicoccoides]|uniref:uncharacterized protein LOC119359646 isoform X2 n=1 Tax=Triticum dicoccoides TaxID=85692 RepID=UPI0018903E87|nr:uncharacterized protein LOC119359646 isoform X2 [Triticum dicoccoides]